MKRISKKIFTLIFGAIFIGIFMINKVSAYPIGGPGGPEWDPTLYYLSPAFWAMNPLDSDVSLVTFGDNVDSTVYTQKFNNYTQGDCSSFTVQHVNPGDGFGYQPPEGLTANTMYILSEGFYNSSTITPLSGNCVGILGTGNVVFSTEFDITNANNLIVDNIQSTQFEITSKTISNNKNIEIGLFINNIGRNLYFEITGDVSTSVTNTWINNNTLTTGNIVLSDGDGFKKIDISFRDPNTNIFVNHFLTGIILDETQPLFTGITEDNIIITEGGQYNTGISFTFNDINISGATLNGNTYTENTIITGTDTYNFIVTDTAGNSTGINFEVDTTPPTFNLIAKDGQTVISGGYYNTGIEINFSDPNLLIATINGTEYINGSSIYGSGNFVFVVSDSFGNSTGITFIIDIVKPTLTTKTITDVDVINGKIYNKHIYATFTDTYLSGATLNGYPYISGTVITGEQTHTLIVSDLAKNERSISFSIDTTPPSFTGTTEGGQIVTSGSVYTTGVMFTFADINLSGATVNNMIYMSGNLLNIEDNYIFNVKDTAGNSTGVMFSIDYTAPILTGTTLTSLPVVSGGIYTTGVRFTFTDTTLSGALLDGIPYTSGTTISIEGSHELIVYDRVGNNTAISFSIDTTAPSFTGITQGGQTVTSGGAYNTGLFFTFNQADVFTATVNSIAYTSGSLISGENTYIFSIGDSVGNTTNLPFDIDYTKPVITGTTQNNVIVTSGTLYNTGIIFNASDETELTLTIDGNAYIDGNIFVQNGNHIFVATDKAGNISAISFGINTSSPSYSAKTQKGDSVTNNGIYNTGVYFTFETTYVASVTVDNIPYTSGTIINGEGSHIFRIVDLIGNIGTLSFTIDKTSPTIIGTTQNGQTITSGGIYNTGVSFTFSDSNISATSLDGNLYIAGTVVQLSEGIHTISALDQAANIKNLVFYIDKTAPIFSGETIDGKIVVSGGYYNTGVFFNFSDSNLSGAKLGNAIYTGGTIISGENIYTLTISDKAGNTTGMIFTVDKTAPSCGVRLPLSGANISGTYIGLSWSNCTDNFGLSGDTTVNIYDALDNLISTTNTTGSSLNHYGESGIYKWNMIIFDKAGNQGTMGMQSVNYTKTLALSLQNPAILYQNIYYINSDIINFTITGNMAFTYQFTGDTYTTGINTYTNGVSNQIVVLSGTDGTKTLTMKYGTGTQTGSIGPMTFYLDRVNPIITGIYPTPLLKTNQTGINFQRSASDTGASIAGYVLEFDGNIVYTGTATSYLMTGIAGATHTWKVSVIDRAGNTNSTAISAFTVDTYFPKILGVTTGYHNTDITATWDVGTGVLNGKTINSGTPITGDGTYKLIVTSDVGNASSIDFIIDKTKPTLTLNTPTTGTIISGSNNINFQRNGDDTNISGYVFNLYGPYFTGFTTTLSSITIPNVPNNDYTWDVKAIDKAGNEYTANAVPFKVLLPLAGTVNISGTITNNGNVYTNTLFGLQIFANKSANINIIGDIASGNIVSTVNANTINGFSIYPTMTDGIKSFTIQITTGSESFTKLITGYLDITAPSIPSFAGQATNYSGAFSLYWTGSSDAGVGMENYSYTILSGTNIVKQGTTSTTSIKIENLEIGGTGTYTIYVAAKDKLGNTSTSGNLTFGYIGLPDMSPNSFSISKKYDVELDEEIESEKITVTGLSTGTKVLASVEDGKLIINGDDSDEEGYVENGDEVQIAIFSSEEYDDITEGILTIGDKSSTFKVTTIKDSNSDSNSSYKITELSTTQKLHTSLIYKALSDLYEGSKQEDFMLSLKTIVKDKIEEMEDGDEDEESIETMKYLYNLINKDFEGDNAAGDSSYTAPNGKKYNITYNATDGYTATNFIKTKYFDTLSEIKSYIDKNNPASVYSNIEIDQSRSSSSYKAPNGKIYIFFKTTDGKYGSNNFQTAKLFTDLEVMKKHIAINNR